MGKFGRDNVWQKWMNEDFGQKIWQMNRSTKRLLIVATNLDSFGFADLPNFLPAKNFH